MARTSARSVFDAAVGNAEALGESFVERRRRLLFHFHDLHVERGGLARELLVRVIGAEGGVELARVAGSDAEQRIFEFLHDLVRADDDGNAVTAAAFEFDAFDLAGEVARSRDQLPRPRARLR